MKQFVRKHEARIHGVLSCFDRMPFGGYLPIMSGWSMAQLLNGLDVEGGSLKPFLLQNAERVKDHAIAMAKKYKRPFQYLASPIRTESPRLCRGILDCPNRESISLAATACSRRTAPTGRG